ncbi:MAG: hypothetical protein KIS67_21255 [Verrucomicrobiae bacterium]|nr:hypothetical protein [Verrucomicrobiae bacterium]
MSTNRRYPLLPACLVLLVALGIPPASAATFPGNARVEVADSSGGLSWNPAANVLTVQCWFKLAVPSGTNLTENMTILVNRRTGTPANPHAFLIQYNFQTGNVEFSARGSGAFTNALIVRPYLDRWYHVAVVRQGESFTGYVDGREVFSVPSPQTVGNAANTDGISIGGWAGGRFLYGEVQEVSIRQEFLDRNFINEFMFSDQPTNNSNLKGYFKLGYSTNQTDRLRNFAPAPLPAGTETATATGAVEFEEASQSGEQSKFDSLRNGGRDALAPLSGAFAWQQTALARPTPGLAFDFRIGYSSANAFGGFKLGNADPYAAGPLGPGWRHSFESRVIPSQDFLPAGSIETIGLMNWDGSIETWDADLEEGIPTGNYHTRHGEYRGELYFTNTFCEWRTSERLTFRYRHPFFGSQTQRGLLVDVRDFNGNSLQLLRDGSGIVTQIVDSVNGRYDLRYQGSLLTNVTFNDWRVNFAYDATNRLVSKSLTNTSGLYTAVNNTWQFQYGTNGLLARIIDPRGFTNVFVQYDQYGRQTNQLDALGRATATRYGVPGKRQITRIDPGTNSWTETYDRKGRVLAQQDPLTNVTSYAYDTNGNRIAITEPLGWQTTFGYDDRANVIARTNAHGEVTRWTIHSFFNKVTSEMNPLGWTNHYELDNATGNLLQHRDALGALVSYTYATNGLVLTSTDGNGRTTQFAYDTNGFLIARTDPATNTWQFTVNDVGWKLAEINPFNDPTTFTYDLNGNALTTTDPLNRTFTRQWDASGNLLAQSDGKGQFTRHAYDAANQRVATTNRAGHVWQFTFTPRGKPERTVNPLGHTSTNFYDAANRLVRVADPLGNTLTNQYDANGNLLALFDPLGQRWAKTYDRLNRVIAETDPLGNTRQTTYDAAGRIAQIITPNGHPSLHAYDGRGRLKEWTDPEGFPWRYDYDGNSNITNITDALAGRYVMAYGPRNERTLERNQDGFEWQYTYDPMLRLKTQRDPNQTLRTRHYDAAGRVTTHTLSTGREDTYTYDDNDNPRAISRRVNGVSAANTSLTYDTLDRVTRTVDTHGQAVDYGLDALGRVTSLTYPGNRTLTNRYDPLGRLTNQVDWAARQTHYQYDKAGRLVRRVYPNGVVQTNTFDTAGRITGLSHSPLNPQLSTINLALTYAYDRNGNKIGGGEKGTLQWPLPFFTEESANYSAAGRLQTRSITNTATNGVPSPGGEGQGEGGLFSYHYDTSGNLTNAVMTAGGVIAQTWRLTYDEDNRTTSILWDTGLTSKLITNRYDALGRRIARRLDGVETRYVLDLSGNMERILCDTTAAGQITAWYVHGPDLSYRVDATNGLLCYHVDAQANVIALTDAQTNLVAQYAYTPYGRSLGSSAISNLQSQISNPYTFVGSQGVMEELPGLYFMRARYYSADAGLFLSTDPVKKIGPGWKPVAYAYADGNPLRFVDPRGEFFEPVTFSIGAAFVLGVASEVIPHFLDTNVPDPDILTGTYTEVAAFFGSPDPWSKAFLAGRLITRGGYAAADLINDIQQRGGSSSQRKNDQPLPGNSGANSTRSSSGSSLYTSPTAGTTPMINPPPPVNQPQFGPTITGGNSGGGASGGGSSQLTQITPDKANYGNNLNGQQQYIPPPPTTGSGGSIGSLGGSGGTSGVNYNPSANNNAGSTIAYNPPPPSPPPPASGSQNQSLLGRLIGWIGGLFR